MHKISRRSFIFGGGAAAVGAGLALSGCGLKSSDLDMTNAKAEIIGGMAYSSNDFDPVGNSNALILACGWHVFEGLYEYDHRNGNIVEGLADGDPIKVDELTYDINIKKGEMFSDGAQISAASIQEAIGSNLNDPTFCSLLDAIKSVELLSEYRLRIHLKYPFESMLKERLSIVRVFKEPDKQEDTGKKPLGSGPWIYKSAEGYDGGVINLMPNGKYTGEYPPRSKTMQFKVIKDDDKRLEALINGDINVMESVPIKSIKTLESKGKKVEIKQSLSCPLVMFNTIKAPFNDVRVRQAILYAINEDKIISDYLEGHGKISSSFLPETHKNYHRAKNVYNYNPELSKQLLKQAGVEKFSFELIVAQDSWIEPFAKEMESSLDALGIDCNLKVCDIDWKNLNIQGKVLPFDVIITPGDPSVFGESPDLLMSWWYGDNAWTKTRSCWQQAPNSRWKEFNSLLQKAREANGDTQQQLWNQCFDLLSEEVPMYPLIHREIASAYDPQKVKDFEAINTSGLWLLNTGVAK